jgi:hypothetical protein
MTDATCLSTMEPVVGLTGGARGVVERGVHSTRVVVVMVLGQTTLEKVEVTVLVSMVYLKLLVSIAQRIILAIGTPFISRLQMVNNL